jgi:isochorismate pyruvate lyase
MAEVRAAIDALDTKLVRLLAERQRLIDAAIAVKRREGLPARIDERVQEVLDHVTREAGAAGVSPELAQELWKTMVEWFIAYEELHLDRKDDARL